MFKQENQTFNINEYINSSENSICRLCLNKFQLNELEDLFQPFLLSQEETIAGYVTKFANIPIAKEDCFSKVICRYCLRKLNETVDFRNAICGCNEFLINLYANYSEDRKLIEPDNWAGTAADDYFKNANEDLKVEIKYENCDETEDNTEVVVNELNEGDIKIDVEEHDLIEGDPKIESDLELDEHITENGTTDNETVVSNKKPKKKYGRNHTLRFPCDYCDRVFKSTTGLAAHMNIHTGEFYKCEICLKKFKARHLLSEHRKVHFDVNLIQCKECGKVFEHASSLRNHMEGHSEVPKYQCDLCGKRFRYRASWNSHKIYHHGRPIEQKCEICNKIVRSRETNVLRRHMKRHLDNSEQICPKCGKTFTSSARYKAHLEIHSGQLEFKCEFCPIAYATKKGLRDHVSVTHSTAKPYTCEICGKTFAVRSYWYAHGTVHAKKNPIPCTICNRVYGYASHLIKHMKSKHGVV